MVNICKYAIHGSYVYYRTHFPGHWPHPNITMTITIPPKTHGISLQLMVQKSCITEHVWNPANNKIFTTPTGLSFARSFGSWRMKSFHVATPSAPIPPTPFLVSVVAGGQVIFFVRVAKWSPYPSEPSTVSSHFTSGNEAYLELHVVAATTVEAVPPIEKKKKKSVNWWLVFFFGLCGEICFDIFFFGLFGKQKIKSILGPEAGEGRGNEHMGFSVIDGDLFMLEILQETLGARNSGVFCFFPDLRADALTPKQGRR